MSNELVAWAQPIQAIATRNASAIQQIAASGVDTNRLLKQILYVVEQNPALQKCTPKSVVNSLIQAAEINLTPTSSLGECYLVPYGSECRLQIGYRGYIALARRSGEIAKVTAFLVYDGEYFVWRNGTSEMLEHEPSENSQNANIRAAVAQAVYKDGTKQFDVMWKHEIDAIRKMSKSGSSPDSIWAKHYPEMAKKTVIRRLCKQLPLTIDGLNAIDTDDSNDFRDGRTYTIDYSTGELTPAAKPAAPRKAQTAIAAPAQEEKPETPAHVAPLAERIKAACGKCNPATLSALLKREIPNATKYLSGATPEQLAELDAALTEQESAAKEDPFADDEAEGGQG